MSEVLKGLNPLRHFKYEEFTCKCGCEVNGISKALVFMLDNARELAKIPFKITEKKAQEVKKLASFLEANKSLISNMTLIQIMNFAEENEFKVTRDKVHYTLEFNNFEYLN